MSILVIGRPIDRAGIPALCDRARAVFECDDPGIVDCDIRALAPDAVSIDALARLQLTGRRLGRQIRLRHCSRELRELLAFVGLADVLCAEPD